MRSLRSLLFAALLCAPAHAQVSDVPQSLLTVGTTAVDAGGAPWAFVRWKASPGTLAYGQPLAISVKNAAAATAGAFAPQGTSELAAEPALVKVHLSRAAALGADAAALAADVNAYYDVVRNNHSALRIGETLPPANLSLEEKIARLVQQARTDSKTASTLLNMADVHPALALCTGQAWAGRLTSAVGQLVTVEVRPCDPATGQIGGVVARTSFNAGQPEAMLAPGAPVQVPDVTQTGDRVVKLRWAASDPLRRQFPLLRGFHLYRLPRASAEALGWHTTPPSFAALRANPAVRKMDLSPILTGKLFTTLNVNQFTGPIGDAVTTYYVDDNDRFAMNAAGAVIGVAHPDGAAFYYFATASDLLGREGLVSNAGLGIACVRIPPRVPDQMTLVEDVITPAGGGALQRGLLLAWKANEPIGDNDTGFYEIYRGSAVDTPNADFARPETLPAPIATLAHAPDAGGMMSWRDASLPQAGTGDVTWWYSLRARHTSPCTPDNYSRYAPPLFGTVRNYQAPPAPTGTTVIGCPLTGLYIPDPAQGLFAGQTFIEPLIGPPLAPDYRRVRLLISRPDTAVQWVEMKWTWAAQSPAAALTRYEFPDGQPLIVDFDVPFPTPAPTLSARAGASSGATSRIVTMTLNNAGMAALTATKQLRVEAQAAVFALSEIKYENPVHNAMFRLTANQLQFSGSITPVGNCFAVGAIYADHTPVIITRSLTDVQNTVEGTEVMGNRITFCDPLYTAALTYRGYRPEAGQSACLHQADGNDGNIRPIRVRLGLPPNVGEYRIYRSVDEAPLSLMAQGDGSKLPANAAEVVRDDATLPALASRVAYFGQTFNRAGIGSALIPLGERILIGRRDVATPAMKRPLAAGTAAAPAVRLEWFCPVDGIERFEVRFEPKSSGGAEASLPASGPLKIQALAAHFQSPAGQSYTGGIVPIFRTLEQTALTSAIGGGLGDGPVFTLTQPIPLDKLYSVKIRSLSKAGSLSAWSEAQDFRWEPPPPPTVPAPEPRVPWPARPLPPLGGWGPMLTAKTFRYVTDPNPDGKIWAPWHAGEYPVGVRIGRMGRVLSGQLASALVYYPNFATVLANGRSIMRVQLSDLANWTRGGDPAEYLLPRGVTAADPRFAEGNVRPARPAESLLPAVLYRTQIANARYPAVSGDLIQVSPLIEKIAHYPNYDQGLAYSTVIRDPYIGIVSQEPDNVSPWIYIDLYLLDTQPVQKGATYRYTLVRFRADNGEVEEVLDAGEATIPTTL